MQQTTAHWAAHSKTDDGEKVGVKQRWRETKWGLLAGEIYQFLVHCVKPAWKKDSHSYTPCFSYWIETQRACAVLSFDWKYKSRTWYHMTNIKVYCCREGKRFFGQFHFLLTGWHITKNGLCNEMTTRLKPIPLMCSKKTVAISLNNLLSFSDPILPQPRPQDVKLMSCSFFGSYTNVDNSGFAVQIFYHLKPKLVSTFLMFMMKHF